MIRDNLILQIELTPTCNAKCRGCDRFIVGTDIVNPLLPTGKNAHMSLEFFKGIFTDEIKEKMDRIMFTGAYGDAIMHPDLHEIVEFCTKFCAVRIETNGGLHNKDWWARLGKKKITVDFALDGLDNETHSRYRRNVSYDKVLENAIAFIEAGGKAIWSMIEHDHNFDQIEPARKLSEELGFIKFQPKRSRITNYTDFNNKEAKPEYERGEVTIVKSKRIPLKNLKIEFSDREVKKLSDIMNKFDYQSQDEYLNFTDISCGWDKNNKYNIDHNGLVTPCCRFSSLYLQSPLMEQLPDLYYEVNKGRNLGNYQYYLDKYDEHWNSLHHHTLDEILNHQFFTKDLRESWDNTGSSPENPRITNRCPRYCGEVQQEYYKGTTRI